MTASLPNIRAPSDAVFAGIRAYRRNGGVSAAQAVLKHTLVPLRHLRAYLPHRGVLWDLGCGEGIFANLVARLLPELRIVGFDKDAGRIEIARRNALPNARFEVRDVFDLPEGELIDAAIFNDFLHHHPFDKHAVLIESVLRRMRPGGVLVLKEVDRQDKVDLAMTRFFDSRLYPEDRLCFRTRDDWMAVLQRAGVTPPRVFSLGHPWPASRTLFVAARPSDEEWQEEAARIEVIAARNRAARDTHNVVLVTGASGFVGRHLARRLLTAGLGGKPVRLLALTRDPRRVPRELLDLGAEALPGDLDDLPRLRPALEGVAYAFHLAAEVKLTTGTDLWRHNYDGTVALTEALQRLNIRRLVHASTMGAVDRTPQDPCTLPIDETTPPNPLSEYGETKLKAEEAVRGSGLPHSVLRIPWAFGPGMTPDTHVRFLFEGVAAGRAFGLIDFPGRVSVVAVDDVVDALMLVAERADAENEVYFVTGKEPVSLGHLFRTSASIVGRRAAVVPVPRFATWIGRRVRRYLPLQLQNLTSDVLWVSGAKLERLGFRPRVPLRQGLIRLAEDTGHRKPCAGRAVSLVTGAASGIGLELARQMHADGHALLLVDRDAERLRDAAKDLGALAVALDLSVPSSVSELDEYLVREGLQLDWAVNNAGFGARGRVDELPLERQLALIRVNCEALVGLSRLAVSHFRRVGGGTLVNLGSSSAFQPLPYMATYAASKAFVRSFSNSLRGELMDAPEILVVTAHPSGTATGFQHAAGVKRESGERLLSPASVASRIVHAAYARKSDVVIGLSGMLMDVAARLIPLRVQVAVWRKLMQKLR